MRNILACLLISMMIVSCGAQEVKKDLLLGKREVAAVERDGRVIGGMGFQGTIYEFRADSTVLAYNRLDTATVRYERNGTALTYLHAQGSEQYRIDSLSETTLKIYSDVDGIPTTTTMARVVE